MNGFNVGRRKRFNSTAINVHDLDLLQAVCHPDKRNVLSIRRPRRVFVIGIVACELHLVCAVEPHAEQLLFAGNHRDEDHLIAVRRKRRRIIHRMAELVSQPNRAIGRLGSKVRAQHCRGHEQYS